MSEEKFIVSEGDGAKLVPVETKSERTALEKEVDAELIDHVEKGINDFDDSQAITVPAKKKRGRPKKATSQPIREFYCSTCREKFLESIVMKMPAGDGGRFAIFCPQCQKAITFLQPDLDKKVSDLVRDNPTGK